MDCRLAVRQQAAGRCASSCQLGSTSSLFASHSCEQPPTLSPAEQVPSAPRAATPPASCSTHSISLAWHELNGRWHQLHGKLCIFYFRFFSAPVTSLVPVDPILRSWRCDIWKRKVSLCVDYFPRNTSACYFSKQLHSASSQGHCSDWKTSGDITWLHTMWSQPVLLMYNT